MPANLMTEVLASIKNIETQMGQTFGTADKPLLLAVMCLCV